MAVGVGVRKILTHRASVQARVRSGTGLSAGYELKRPGLSLALAVHQPLSFLPPVRHSQNKGAMSLAPRVEMKVTVSNQLFG